MPLPSRPPALRLGVAALALGLTAALQVPTPAQAAAPAAAAAPVTVDGLQVNGRVDPLGIPGAAPSLSWTSQSDARGVVQTGYQVRVATSTADLESDAVWDSGKVASAQQVDVLYAGPALTSATGYVWQVKVWDGADQASEWSAPATFETGLLDSADWGDADWIGGSTGAELNRWSNYTVEYDFHMDNLVFGPIVRGANLSNYYMWQLSVADGTPRFRPHRKLGGGFTVLDNKDISSVISKADLLAGTHTMSITVDGSTFTTKLDGTTIDTRTDTTFSKGYVGFRSSIATEGDETSTVSDVRVTAKDGTTLLDTDFAAQGNPFSAGTLVPGGLRINGNTETLWRSPDNNLPTLRTEFDNDESDDKTLTSARVYATARGIYELNINGDKVGDQFLAPGWTDYDDRITSQTYDVTDLVDDGVNSFGAELADGWWSGRIASWGPDLYDTPDLSVLARLRLDYSDGTSEWVDTDESWTSHTGGYTATDNIDGESYDARAAQPGWSEPGYDDSAWSPVVVRPSATDRLEPQSDEPVRATQELPARGRTEVVPGAFVYDLGQNMVGVARMTLQGKAGTTVTIRYGEELNPDGSLYTANLRSAKVTDRYTFAADGTVTYEPKFTQHGFRYVEISGASVAPAVGDVTGVVWGSDLVDTGTLDTSSDMLNQLSSNISWGQRGNFLSIPTDTPARDERLGWSGDINVFAPTASYLVDTRAFLSKWMVDMRDAQGANGDYPGVAPNPKNGCCGGGTGWADAGITVPYAMWHAYGDARPVREFYDDMSRFFAHVRTSAGSDLIDSRDVYGDWLHLDDATPATVLGTAYFAEDARMMSEMAAAIGEDADAAEFAALSDDIRAAFTATLVGADGTVSGNSQTGYAMALGMGLVSDDAVRAKVGAKFVAKLAAGDNHLTTGFLGTPWLLPALSSIDRDDIAYEMLTHEDYPSWGYEVAQGATTMWERWNSIMPDGSFGDVNMNSFNHYAYGAVGDWMYQNIGAIKAIEPGYKKTRIAPNVGGGLTHGSGTFESVYGTIATDWSTENPDGALTLAVEVPVNTTAEVVLPAANEYAVTEGGALLTDTDGVTDVVAEDGTVTVTVGSGSYDFTVTEASGLLGQILGEIDALQTRVDDLTTAGDLGDADSAELGSAIDGVRTDVGAALLAGLDGDAATVTSSLEAALAGVRDLRAGLADSDVDAPVRADLDGRLGSIESLIVTALTRSVGVTVTLPPVAGAVLPGGTVAGTVEVSNEGDTALGDVEATVSVDGWDDATATLASVPAGESAQLPVSLTVPAQATPGGHDADLELTLTLGDATYTVRTTTADWATVTSGLEVGTPTAVLDGADPSEHATVSVPVSNTGTADVRAHVALDVPDGFGTVPSVDVLVPADGATTVTVPVTLPLDRVAGPAAVTADVVRAGTVLATADASVSFPLVTPPTATVVDHVDFGNGPSESAHGVTGSPSSGTSVEAGYTRRYSDTRVPGSSFSTNLAVPAGEPFILRNIETYDRPNTKKYNIYVDDVLVKTQLVPRTASGGGIEVYDALVDDPSLTTNDGTVRVRFEYPMDAAGFYDPSIADTWVLAVPDDTQEPDVSAVVTDATIGDNGWYRSDVDVAVTAVDNRDAAPLVETGTDDGWNAYTGPVTVSGDGEQELSYRATDEAGNGSGARVLEIGIDTVAPTTELAVTRGPGVEGSDSATLELSATDATSGVARTLYRLDGGAWTVAGEEPVTVTGYGEHVVDYASTDVAGNVEVMRHTTVSLADVEAIAVVVDPVVSGVAKVGRTLSGSTGSWNTKGLSFAYQWLRSGSPIAGATGETYVVKAGDVGRRLAVRVTASKPGLADGVATSSATAAVPKVASTSKVSVNKGSVKTGQKVTVTGRVTASGASPTGKVAVVVDGRTVAKVNLTSGKATVKVKIAGRGKHTVKVRYLGSAQVAASTSKAVTVRAR